MLKQEMGKSPESLMKELQENSGMTKDDMNFTNMSEETLLNEVDDEFKGLIQKLSK